MWKRCSLLILVWFLLLSEYGRSQGPEPVRGTWITNVASDALTSRKKIRETVRLCKKNGLNHLFVVVWNNGVTMYPSPLVEQYTGIRQDPVYKGFDPIACIVKEGHRAGLKVHAWFEFGFSYAYKDTATPWLRKYPHWAGRNAKGELLQKNGFYWWSSLRPDVQEFMLKLVTEVVQRYKVDGVQGDDRLPAMPMEGGYDDYAKQLYARDHQGAAPPANPKDSAFVQWKAAQLSQFGKRLYDTVKSIRPSCLVTWAPSIFPWSREEYGQDWPAWLRGGYADLIIPQLYRYKIDAYEKVLKELQTQVSPADRHRVFPGILTSLGDGYQASRAMMDEMVRLNRQAGFGGEVFFYFETLRRIGENFYQRTTVK